MFRYHENPVLDSDFDCGGFDDILARAASGRSIVPDAPYGEYSADTARHASHSAWVERVGKEVNSNMERRAVEEERSKAAEMERRKQRARDLYFRAEKDRIRREMVDCVITLPIYDKDEWERVVAAHNAWLASWGNNG